MADDELQELLFSFLKQRGGYVAAASEGELFLLLKAVASDAARQERARCASIADEHQRWNTRPGSEGWNIAGAIAGDIRALPDD